MTTARKRSHDHRKENDPMTTASPYVELTSAFTGLPVAIHVDLIGEVRDANLLRSLGRTNVRHKIQRRVNWEVQEEYVEVMRRIQQARDSLVGIPTGPPGQPSATGCLSLPP